MVDYLQRVLLAQYEAALAMLRECLTTCPADHWDGVIGKYPFWHVAYHTLCFADLYLSPSDKAFTPREIHPAGWKEFDDEYPSRRFDKDELLAYIAVIREKAVTALAAETSATLEGPSGHPYRSFSRGELHVFSIRHIQHHTGQLSAYLRRIGPEFQALECMRWVGSGWK